MESYRIFLLNPKKYNRNLSNERKNERKRIILYCIFTGEKEENRSRAPRDYCRAPSPSRRLMMRILFLSSMSPRFVCIAADTNPDTDPATKRKNQRIYRKKKFQRIQEPPHCTFGLDYPLDSSRNRQICSTKRESKSEEKKEKTRGKIWQCLETDLWGRARGR